MFDDHWEFDAPCVMYYPKRLERYGIGGNSGHLDSMLEDICWQLSEGEKPHDGGLDKECEWRGWGRRNFARRRAAGHVVFRVKWRQDPDEDGPVWEVVSRTETWGPPKSNAAGEQPAPERKHENKAS